MTMAKILFVAVIATAWPREFRLLGARALATTYVELPGQALPLLPDDEVSYLQVRNKARRSVSVEQRAAQEPETIGNASVTDGAVPPAAQEVVPLSVEAASPVATDSDASPRVPWPLIGGLTYWPHTIATHPMVRNITEAWERLGRWQEAIFMPVLFGLLWFARFWMFQGMILVQLTTHFVHLFSPFECNPLIWCNLGALVFGVLYVGIALMSLHYKDEDRQPINNRLVSWCVLFVGVYIMISHIAAFFYYEQYRVVFPSVAWDDTSPLTP